MRGEGGHSQIFFQTWKFNFFPSAFWSSVGRNFLSLVFSGTHWSRCVNCKPHLGLPAPLLWDYWHRAACLQAGIWGLSEFLAHVYALTRVQIMPTHQPWPLLCLSSWHMCTPSLTFRSCPLISFALSCVVVLMLILHSHSWCVLYS